MLPLGVIGPWQWVIIALVILLLFGGKKIPELMHGLGKGVKTFKAGMKDAEKDIQEMDIRDSLAEIDTNGYRTIHAGETLKAGETFQTHFTFVVGPYDVENTVVTNMADAYWTLDKKEYFDLLQDYICSVTIRAARDTFALLPVNYVTDNAVDGGKTILSVSFDRPNFQKLRFGMSDPSDIIEGFEHNMKFTAGKGFSPVKEL